MIDLRKIAIIFVIAVLYAIFVFTLVDAVNPDPDRDEYCTEFSEKPFPRRIAEGQVECPDIRPSKEEQQQCNENLGFIQYDYDNRGCTTSYECSCTPGLKELVEKNNLVDFVLFAIFALIAVLVGLYLPTARNPLHEWVGTGFMLGGLVTLFIGTARFFGDLAKPLRPVVILVELVIVLYLSYKKLGSIKAKK